MAKEFVTHRIAPLQAHSQPMWTYKGRGDRMRLSQDDLRPEVVDSVLDILFASPSIPAAILKNAEPLYRFELASVLKFVKTMPAFNQWGLEDPAEEGPREGSRAAPREAPSAGEAPEASAEAGAEDDAAGGPDPSAGGARPSRGKAPAKEVMDLSSGDSGGEFFISPSKAAEEEESADDGAPRGRYDPRTKAAHDRPAGGPREAASREEKESEPREGAGSEPRRARKGKRWRGADE